MCHCVQRHLAKSMGDAGATSSTAPSQWPNVMGAGQSRLRLATVQPELAARTGYAAGADARSRTLGAVLPVMASCCTVHFTIQLRGQVYAAAYQSHGCTEPVMPSMSVV